MKPRWIPRLTVIAVVCASLDANAQSLDRNSAAIAKLPDDLRPQGKLLLTETQDRQRAVLADTIGKINPNGTRDFLLSILQDEKSSVVRRTILDRLVRVPNPQVMQALARHAAADPDPEVAIFALDRYRYERMLEIRQILNQRLALSAQLDDEAGRSMLAKEDERWISLVRGTMLPSFLQDPGPTFSIKTNGDTIRVLAFGDYGNGSNEPA